MAFLFNDDKSKKDLNEALEPTLTALETSYKANIKTIADAITDEGITTAATATPAQMAENIHQIKRQTYTLNRNVNVGSEDYGLVSIIEIDTTCTISMVIECQGPGDVKVVNGMSSFTLGEGDTRTITPSRNGVTFENKAGRCYNAVTMTQQCYPR